MLLHRHLISIIAATTLALGLGCKPAATVGSRAQETTDESSLETICRQDPGQCETYRLMVASEYVTNCSRIWQEGGDNVYAFDENGIQYNLRYQRVYDGQTQLLNLGQFIDQSSQRLRQDIGSTMDGVVARAKLPNTWRNVPIGFRPGSTLGDLETVPMKFYAARVSNKILNRTEWVIFRTFLPKNDVMDYGRSRETRLAFNELIRQCYPVRGQVDTGNMADLSKTINALNQGEEARAQAEELDALYKGMVTFVESAPLTGEVATIYKGCYLGESSCFRAAIVVTANVASYAVLAPAKVSAALGSKGYLVVTSVGAAANVIEGGLQAKDGIAAAREGHYGVAALHGMGATFRFVAATGLVLEATKAAAAVRMEALAASDDIGTAFGRPGRQVKPEFIESYEMENGLVRPNPKLRSITKGQEPIFNDNGPTLWTAVDDGGTVDVRIAPENKLPGPGVPKPGGKIKMPKDGHCTHVFKPTPPDQMPRVIVGGETKPLNASEFLAGEAQVTRGSRLLDMNNDSGRYSKFVGDTKQALLATARHTAIKTGTTVRVTYFDWPTINASADPSKGVPNVLGWWTSQGQFVSAGKGGFGIPLPARPVRDQWE